MGSLVPRPHGNEAMVIDEHDGTAITQCEYGSVAAGGYTQRSLTRQSHETKSLTGL